MDRSPDIVLTLTLLGVACLVVAWCASGRRTGAPTSRLSPAGAKIVDALTEFRDDLNGRCRLSDAEMRRRFPATADRLRQQRRLPRDSRNG